MNEARRAVGEDVERMSSGLRPSRSRLIKIGSTAALIRPASSLWAGRNRFDRECQRFGTRRGTM